MSKEYQKTFWKIWAGQAISIVTSAIVQFAIIWYITYKTNSAFWLALASLCGFLPQGILGIFVGSYIDKHNRKNIMMISDASIALVSLILGIMALFMELPIWLILIALILRSIGSAFHFPSLQASMPLIIPKENLLKYSGYSQAIQSISLIISPVVASFLYEQIKLSYIIFLDVIGAIIAIFSVFISVIPNIKLDTSKTSFIKDTKEAIKLILSKPKIKALFLFTAIFMIVFMPINSLFPLMTKNYFGGTTYHAGIIEMLFAVGMLIGSILLSTTKHFKDEKRNILIALLLMGISLLISGLISSSQFIIFTIMALVMGFTGPIFNGTTSTILGKEIEPGTMTGRSLA
jgi:DHA3 family macrolide efflux protein-like MFS transporter